MNPKERKEFNETSSRWEEKERKEMKPYCATCYYWDFLNKEAKDFDYYAGLMKLKKKQNVSVVHKLTGEYTTEEWFYYCDNTDIHKKIMVYEKNLLKAKGIKTIEEEEIAKAKEASKDDKKSNKELPTVRM